MPPDPRPIHLESSSGIRAAFNANGSLRRLGCGDIVFNLFAGSEVEGGPANLWLRQRRNGTHEAIALLGPGSSTRVEQDGAGGLVGEGAFDGLRYTIALRLAADAPAWFWHVSVENVGDALDVDLVCVQDIALAPYGAIRLNEFYVSQYVDHTPLTHSERGVVIASRQNQAAAGRHPWCVMGSLRRGASFATDALQVYGLTRRNDESPAGLVSGLPGKRLQHEHSMVAIQDESLRLGRGARATFGFFGAYVPDHPAATSDADLSIVDATLALPEAGTSERSLRARSVHSSPTLFTQAPLLNAMDLHEPQFVELFGAARRHEERDDEGRLLSFFCGEDRHVVLRAKELLVLRPHGHLLRTGDVLTPDEAALTSTTWMGGVFHSMLTQGHVSINRFLSTVHSYLGLFRSHGQRVFADLDGAWRLLDTPSAYEMSPAACRWIYRHEAGEIEVISAARSNPHEFSLQVNVRSGAPTRFLIAHHVALNGDDGNADGAALWRREGEGVAVVPIEGSELHKRFPNGSFLIAPEEGTTFEQIGGDEIIFLDGRSRAQPYVCLITKSSKAIGLRIQGRLIDSKRTSDSAPQPPASSLQPVRIAPPPASPLACSVRELVDIAPWFTHNALIHYLSPRGLEQYSGGGWGTRDVSQGPVELLLSLGCAAPVRDLLLRVMRAQDPAGDWPQWFMFFDRERAIRAPDSHGDVVFWPLLALAQYLLASGDGGVLDAIEPFYAAEASHTFDASMSASVWEHVQRALSLIERRVVRGTALAAYGHGDWNDSLQPADPAMREHMCSAWTVTLHHQMLTTLARALRLVSREADAVRLEAQAEAVRRDFQRLLIVDEVLAGYALFEQEAVQLLLHPRDRASGVRYSALAMIHAILENMLTPAQARTHLSLIEQHLIGPDGVRLFDRPMPYHGGPQHLFQRAESATFFGREIGLMYMHAHLRYAQALAHVGDADGFFHALCQVNPIGIRTLVPQATLRQSNCYYSSSDAVFADRYEASAEYARVARGDIALDGGWRVYSSGAGISMSLIVRRFLGVYREHDALVIDPVLPSSLNGMTALLRIDDRPLEVHYEVSGCGSGVESATLNGVPLALTYEENPYRQGAARAAMRDVSAILRDRDNAMRVRVGR